MHLAPAGPEKGRGDDLLNGDSEICFAKTVSRRWWYGDIFPREMGCCEFDYAALP